MDSAKAAKSKLLQLPACLRQLQPRHAVANQGEKWPATSRMRVWRPRERRSRCKSAARTGVPPPREPQCGFVKNTPPPSRYRHTCPWDCEKRAAARKDYVRIEREHGEFPARTIRSKQSQ